MSKITIVQTPLNMLHATRMPVLQPTLQDALDQATRRTAKARKPRCAPSRNRGFTLLEMLAVIVLIAIVATVTVRQIGNGITKGKVGAGKAQLSSLGMKIDSYTMDNGSPPASLNALTSRPDDAPNWHGPYARPSELRDPFGHAFGYKAPGDHGNDYDLIFFGRDGRPGGTGYDADFGNWQ